VVCSSERLFARLEKRSIKIIYKKNLQNAVSLVGAKFGLRVDGRKYLSVLMDRLLTQIASICLGPTFLPYFLYSRCALPNNFQRYELIFLRFCTLSGFVGRFLNR
jgi:hypothetical protein